MRYQEGHIMQIRRLEIYLLYLTPTLNIITSLGTALRLINLRLKSLKKACPDKKYTSSLLHLRRKKLENEENLNKELHEFFDSKSHEFHANDIHDIHRCWREIIVTNEEYYYYSR